MGYGLAVLDIQPCTMMCWAFFIPLRPQIRHSFEQISMDSFKVALLIIGSQDTPRIEIPRCRGSSDLLAWQPT